MTDFILSLSFYGGLFIFSLILVSRRSWERAGVRFHTQGIDPCGNVANFIETEQILEHENILCSFVQV